MNVHYVEANVSLILENKRILIDYPILEILYLIY